MRARKHKAKLAKRYAGPQSVSVNYVQRHMVTMLRKSFIKLMLREGIVKSVAEGRLWWALKTDRRAPRYRTKLMSRFDSRRNARKITRDLGLPPNAVVRKVHKHKVYIDVILHAVAPCIELDMRLDGAPQ